MTAGSTVTIEPRIRRPLVMCTACGNFGPFVDREEGRAFKAKHSLVHQRERDAAAARGRRAGGKKYPPECFTADVSRDRYGFEDLQ